VAVDISEGNDCIKCRVTTCVVLCCLDLASDDILSSLFLCLSLLAAIGLPYMLERAGLDVQQGNVYIVVSITTMFNL
jgi:hypothetical protein